jgi:regulator of protease activity HflC (stomatin/prohibitin superfamily)
VKLALAAGGWCIFWLVVFLVCYLLTLNRKSVPPVINAFLVISVILAVLSGYFSLQLFTAKQRAINSKQHCVPLLFGLARLVTWEQNEGLIFLRNKRIEHQIYGPVHGGGLRIIYPFLGEELRGRVPLTLQLTWFQDERVLTRESIQLSVKMGIWWQVDDLEKYFYTIDHEVHAFEDQTPSIPGPDVVTYVEPSEAGPRDIAEIWVLSMAESCLRGLISGTSAFLIVSKHAASCLRVEGDNPTNSLGSDDYTPATPDVLAHKILAELQPQVNQYGLRINRIEIQEVQLPASIQQAVDDVWVASTQPAKTGYEAEALRKRLIVLCDLLGKEAVAAQEIVKSLPTGSLLGNPLATLQMMLDTLRTSGSALPGPSPTGIPGPTPGKPIGPPG